MARKLRTAATLALCLLCSCERTDPVVDGPGEGGLVRWAVEATGSGDASTRAMIKDFDALALACTPEDETYLGAPGEGKSIGFYADYTVHHYGPGEEDEVLRDVFGAKVTKLVHSPMPGSPTDWNYATSALTWNIGGSYMVRSYFPQSLSSEIISSSDSKCFLLGYNTHSLQEDLMVAYNRVYTVDPVTGSPSIQTAQGTSDIDGDGVRDPLTSAVTGSEATGHGYSQPFDLSKPIPLFFAHTLAALRFQFVFTYGEDGRTEEDELLSCYLSNSDDIHGLHTVGLLVYGDNIADPPALDTYEAMEERWREFRWISNQNIKKDIPFYNWGVGSEGQGIPFTRTMSTDGLGRQVTEDQAAVAYSSTDRRVYKRHIDGVLDPSSTAESAGSRTLVMSKEEAPYYNENDGWLLVIPQKSSGGLRLHFETRKMGWKSVPVTAYTGTAEDGGTPSVGEDNWYLAGHRYTYTVQMDMVDLRVSVACSPWKEIYSVETIDL